MLYKKSRSKELDLNLFKNPSSEYRAAPFWSWNCKLEGGMLTRQIEQLKKMGFGGFFMHTRSGMATEYLSDEFMGLIKLCCQKAEKENMLAWLYDEDRWPSGAAGGIVTKEIKYRRRFLQFTAVPMPSVSDLKKHTETGAPYFVGAYIARLDESGRLQSYERLPETQNRKIPPAGSVKRYAYIVSEAPSGWFNNQAYLDTLSAAAADRFIEVTYNAYKKAIPEYLGSVSPAIFTDEPQHAYITRLPFAKSESDAAAAWTPDFEQTFTEEYGYLITDKLPELFWDLQEGAPSCARYDYHKHLNERFACAFSARCGDWCEKNGIALTGHMNNEACLESQTASVTEAMRHYIHFGLPGIDMLCDNVELNTAKQAQSVARQNGAQGVMSELYGVTYWSFDFRGHKFQGDWQAAMGVTVRVPHLSWVSMKGSAKRDYPASINYQSPWYEKYPYIEDHFARLNTVLTRGEGVVNVGVIHPIESYWLHFGPNDTSFENREKLEKDFKELTKILLDSFIDFDFISESLLPMQHKPSANALCVGKMKYDTVIVPPVNTLRTSTLKILNEFVKNGGRLIFTGKCPEYADAKISSLPRELYDKSERVQLDESAIFNAFKERAFLAVSCADGKRAKNFVYTLRNDNGKLWLFLARRKKTQTPDSCQGDRLFIALNGGFAPVLYDTVNGGIQPLHCSYENGKTVIEHTLYAYDSLLLCLNNGKAQTAAPALQTKKASQTLTFKDNVKFALEEDNVYVLDLARARLNGGELWEEEEILRIDKRCRDILSFPMANGRDIQPWAIQDEKIIDFAELYFDVQSQIDTGKIYLAAEELESVILNGSAVKLKECGWFVDESIIKYRLPALKKGGNSLVIKMPIGKRTGLENAFLLGDFDVEVRGARKVIKAPSKKIGFSDLTVQGMPFYGGNVVYRTRIDTPECSLKICANRYKGALISVKIDGKEAGNIVFSPYTLTVNDLAAGSHIIEFTLYGTRVNTFGSLHNVSYDTWYGPNYWYPEGDKFSYEYNLKKTGILASPVIEIIEK